MPIFGEVLAATGLAKDDIGFWCSGSSDYLAGRAFSFVQAVDAIGAFPPIMESHVEMDGAWALYEAWVKILTGEADVALAYGFGKSSAGQLRRVLALQLDPYLVAPLWPDSVAIAALQARLGLEAGLWSEKDMAEVAARSRAAAMSNPQAQLSGEVSAEELLEAPYLADPLRAHDCAPVGDGAAAVILASGERARELCERPAWITGFEHRIDSASLGARDLTTAPSAAAAGQAAGAAGVDAAELHAPFTHQEILLRGALGLGDGVRVNPSGGALRRQPDVRRGPGADRDGGARDLLRPVGPGARPRHQRPRPAAEPRLRHGGAARDAAPGRRPRGRPDPPPQPADRRVHRGPVPGGGRPRARRRRPLAGRHRRGRGREGARPVRGRDDARAVPGRRARRHRQAAAAGAHGGLGRRRDRDRRGQPGPGGPAPPGARGRVREAVGVQRHVGAVDRAAVQHAAARGRGRVLRAAHPRLHPPQRRARSRRRAGRGQGPAQRQPQPLRPPAAARHHAGVGALLPHAVGPGPLRRDLPVLRRRVRRGHRRPGGGRGRAVGGRPVAWIRATSMRTEPTMFAGKDHVNPRAGADAAAALWRQAGITDPLGEIDVAEIYVPFSWFEPMWLENLGFAEPGRGWRLTEAGETQIGGALPVNPSGGVLCSNPIGASGLLRFAEAALQVMGKAGRTRWPGPGPRSATPTAAARSTSRCGSWPPPPRDPQRLTLARRRGNCCPEDARTPRDSVPTARRCW